MIRIICITVLVAVIGQGCLTDPDCVSTTLNYVTVNFYDGETNERDTLFFTTISAVGSDSLLANAQSLRTVLLPLDPRSPSATYVFDSNIGIDTLVLGYKVGTRLISEDCGLEFIYTSVDNIRSDFDSISVVNQIPLEEIAEDIRIFN